MVIVDDEKEENSRAQCDHQFETPTRDRFALVAASELQFVGGDHQYDTHYSEAADQMAQPSAARGTVKRTKEAKAALTVE